MQKLQTQRLELRPIEQGDLTLLEQVFCSSTMMEFVGETVPVAAIPHLMKWYLDYWAKNKNGVWVMELRDTKQRIGLVGLHKVFIEGFEHDDLSYMVLPEFQRKGYALEALKRFLEYLFVDCHLARVSACPRAQNQASVLLLKKVGFSYIKVVDIFVENKLIYSRMSLWQLEATADRK